VKKQNLSDRDKNDIVSVVASFIDAREKLHMFIHIPIGEAHISQESTELNNLWHNYLIRGRELIDELGRKIDVCFGLKQTVHGLNAKKFESLRTILSKESTHRGDLKILEGIIKKYESDIIEFIGLRNREKESRDTLVRPPVVSPSGEPQGGVVMNFTTNKEYDFVHYFDRSFATIIEFTRAICGN
jgi:hypothetical protein